MFDPDVFDPAPIFDTQGATGRWNVAAKDAEIWTCQVPVVATPEPTPEPSPCPDPGAGFATIVNADAAFLLNADDDCITAAV